MIGSGTNPSRLPLVYTQPPPSTFGALVGTQVSNAAGELDRALSSTEKGYNGKRSLRGWGRKRGMGATLLASRGWALRATFALRLSTGPAWRESSARPVERWATPPAQKSNPAVRP